MILGLIPDGVRLRVSSIEPEDLTLRFFEQLAHPRMCPHLHMPVQSGSDKVLASMRRRYTVRDYIELAERFRDACPDGALTTDILVGFPTETEDDFAATLKLCDEVRFERIHGFPFSPRPGTKAAKLNPLPRRVSLDRNRRLIAHCREIADEQWQRFVGRNAMVLIEEPAEGGWLGHGEAYQVVRAAGDAAIGGIRQVQLLGYEDGAFTGQVIT
jgi:tRNA A37 methylthiotransferase MiaB